MYIYIYIYNNLKRIRIKIYKKNTKQRIMKTKWQKKIEDENENEEGKCR